MPSLGMLWRHIICNTRNTWLPGDERGFRNRGHRINSSGDYKNPPPKEEHKALRQYFHERADKPISFPQELLRPIALGFRDRFQKEKFMVLALSCSMAHLHALVELPNDLAKIRVIVGRCKRCACEAVKDELPGSIWAAAGEYRPIKDFGHQRNTYGYITTKQGRGTFVWTFEGQEYWMA